MRIFYLLALLACIGFVSCTPVGGFSGSNVPGASAQGGVNGNGVFQSANGVGNNNQSGVSTTARPSASDLGNIQRAREAQVTSGGIGNPFNPEAGAFSNGSGGGNTTDDIGSLPPLPSLSTNYRYAIPVPGRKGWVYNPYTNTTVDARGVESGRLIYDETDPANRREDGTLKPIAEMPHKFRVP